MNMNNTLFFSMIFILGVILVVTSNKVDGSIQAGCTSDKLRNANKGILVIGVVFMVSSVAYMICHSKCNCGGSGSMDTKMYVGFSLVLGIVLTVLGGIVKGQSDKANCDVKGEVSTVLGIGVIMIVLCSGYLGYEGYKSGMFSPKSGARSLQRTEMASMSF
jgi:hypothetical protein